MSRLAEIHHQLQTFNQMIAPYFHIDASLPNHLPPMHTGHKFETVINGVTMDVRYVTKWNSLEGEDQIVWQSIKAELEGCDLMPLFGEGTVTLIHRAVEHDFISGGEE